MRAVAGINLFSEVMAWRHLLWSLTSRDVYVRYKQSLLGIAWAILQPLSLMLVFTFVFTRAIDARSVLSIEMPYALYAYVGLVPWTFFGSSLTGCVNALVANRNLVTKVYFPREVLPLSCIAGSFVDFCIASTVLVGLGLYFHTGGQWTFTLRPAICFIPVIIAVQVMLTIGLGLILSMANLFYRDVRQLTGVTIQLWMFVSAVVVPVPTDGSLLSRVIALNPLVPIIGGYRDCLIHGRLPDSGPFVYAVVVSLVLLVAGVVLFRRASSRFAECI